MRELDGLQCVIRLRMEQQVADVFLDTRVIFALEACKPSLVRMERPFC